MHHELFVWISSLFGVWDRLVAAAEVHAGWWTTGVAAHSERHCQAWKMTLLRLYRYHGSCQRGWKTPVAFMILCHSQLGLCLCGAWWENQTEARVVVFSSISSLVRIIFLFFFQSLSVSLSGLRFMDVILHNFMRVKNGYTALHSLWCWMSDSWES